jgi:type IV pilus assembly protein PilY1
MKDAAMNLMKKTWKSPKSWVAAGLSSLALSLVWWAHAATLDALFDTDLAPVAYVGMPAVSSNNVSGGSEVLYAIDYDVSTLNGNLHAYAISSAGVISATDSWQKPSSCTLPTGDVAVGASVMLSCTNWDTGRKIVTLKDDGSKVAFRHANLSATQQGYFSSSAQVNWLRGDRSNETAAGGMRTRTSVLGTIIRSSPLYWVDPPFYAASGATQPRNCASSSICKTVFVGANDGMLHAFDASTGQERFAFVPRQHLNVLGNLSDPNYAHEYFMDGQLSIKSYPQTSANQVILAGALGAGGRGLYALDVSNPAPTSESNAASMILWEKSANDTDYANLGYVFGRITLSLDQSGNPALFTGNGYNNGEDGVGDGRAYLMVINAKTGALIRSIATDTSGSTSAPNGLSPPTLIDTDLDGRPDLAFAGDLGGNLWKFDLKSNTSTKLYTADDGKAITMAPSVTAHPKGGFMVIFVTGKNFVAADGADTATHAAYGIWDQAPSANTTLLAQTITESLYGSGSSGIRTRTVTSNQPDWATHKGWKTPLPVGGERVVGGDGATIAGGVFRFFSTNPTINPSSITPNENWWMELNPITGGGTGTLRFDLNADGKLDSADALSSGSYPVGRFMGPGTRSQLVALYAGGYTVFHANYDRNGSYTPQSTSRGVAGGHFDVEFYKAPGTVCSGQSSGGGSRATGSVDFKFTGSQSSQKASYISISVTPTGGTAETIYTASYTSKKRKSASSLVNDLDEKASSNYTITEDPDDDTKIIITANANGSAWNGTINVVLKIGDSSSAAAASNYTIVNMTGGTNSTATASDSDTKCSYSIHHHEYDDLYDRTGVNMLNPSDSNLKLSNAITASTSFKVLVMNQYLSPAATIHIGDSTYRYDSAAGYKFIKNFQTSSTLSVSALPTYTLSTIGSLAINLPTDGFAVDNWWGTGDLRVGLHPTSPQCVFYGQVGSGGSLSANILADYYTPAVPPANGTNGAATLATTSTVANAVRHNGALTVQIIKSTTPDSAVEQNVAGRPEYGYRVKSSQFYTYVLAEYSMFWHHPRRLCYHDSTTRWYNGSSYGNGYSTGSSGPWNTSANMIGTGWTKNPPDDTSSDGNVETPASGSTDPKLGSFQSISGAIGSGTTTGGTGGGGTSSSSMTNIVTGGAVVVAAGGTNSGTCASCVGYSGTAPAAPSTSTPPPLLKVQGTPSRTGRVNWREISP